MHYLHWEEKTITDFSDTAISALYDRGYVFTRLGKGIMHQTRSVRIDLTAFALSSENRRILKKIDGVALHVLALPRESYDFTLGKLAKDFYDTKFGPGIMSAQKIKEMISDGARSNFNLLLSFVAATNGHTPGYAICYTNKDMLHYSYPFYSLTAPKDMGLGMMITAIQYAQNAGMRYVYLGSLQRPTDTYKLQFAGLEWFDGNKWSADIEEVKKLLTSSQ